MLQAIGRSKRVTFDGVMIRIHQAGGLVTILALRDLAAVELRSATAETAGYLRFARRTGRVAVRPMPEHDELCIWFSEWREGGFARLHDAIDLARRPATGGKRDR